MIAVTIVIPTYKRPDDLRRLLASIRADIGERRDVCIVVADNDVNRTAESVVKSFASTMAQSISYRVADIPGVSNARNVGMQDIASRYVLFLDDDMEVVPPYLDPMLETAQQYKTTLTFAPAIANLPEGAEALAEWLVPLFSRTLAGPSRIVAETLGTGGCLVDLEGIILPSPVFDPALNEVGGEDDAFFKALMEQGGTVGWCAEANAWEHVPPHRATPDYLWKRHFAFGQTPTREAADRGLRGCPTILKWTIVGGVQTAVHGALYLGTRLLGRPSRMAHLGRLAQGLGKVFWWDGLSPRLYGSKAR